MLRRSSSDVRMILVQYFTEFLINEYVENKYDIHGNIFYNDFLSYAPISRQCTIGRHPKTIYTTFEQKSSLPSSIVNPIPKTHTYLSRITNILSLSLNKIEPC